MRRDLVRPVTLASLFLSGVALCFAGQEFKISDNADYVLLDVSVRNAKGAFVSGLTRSSFAVLEDGKPRAITFFSDSDMPVAIGLVMDNSGSMAAKRSQLVTAGLSFAKESNPHDDFFVVNFNDSVVRGLPPRVPFTDNLEQLKKALYYGPSEGKTALYDAVAYGLRHLERSEKQRRTLIVVSDGRDNASKMTLPQLKTDLEASRATVYTIGLADPTDRGDLDRHTLKQMADMTGGEFFEPTNVEDVAGVLARISNDIRHRYSIEYAPDEIADKNTTRVVKVVVREDGRKLHALTRKSYSIAQVGEYAQASN